MAIGNGIYLVTATLISLIVYSATSVTGIVSGVILSIFWLKEKFVWQFDVPAILLMILGSVTMTLQADKTDEYTYEQLRTLVKSTKSIAYYCYSVFSVILVFISYPIFLKSLARFEITAIQNTKKLNKKAPD